MGLGRWRSWQKFLPVLGGFFGVAILAGCTVEAPKKKHSTPVEPGADWWGDGYTQTEQPIEPSGVINNSGAFGAPERPSSGGPLGEPPDAGATKSYCVGTVVPGDLAIVELMIASRAGAGDDGEWVEVQNTRPCWLKLKGVSVESPRGSDANAAVFVDDVELAPQESFIAAGSMDPARNHNLPGKVITWGTSDVLKNDGDTVTVKLGDVTIDSLTYPSFTNLTAGRALSFPSDCKPTDRASWSRWSLAFANFDSGYRGTPNAANDDVACY